FKLRNVTTKFILRESMKSVLPKAIYQRKNKLGFPGPEEPLFKYHHSKIRRMYREYIASFPGIFNDNLLTMLGDYERGTIPYDNFFFRVLSFGTWAREFNISSSVGRKKSKTIKYSTPARNISDTPGDYQLSRKN